MTSLGSPSNPWIMFRGMFCTRSISAPLGSMEAMSTLWFQVNLSGERADAAGGAIASWSGGSHQTARAVPFVWRFLFPLRVREWGLPAEIPLTLRAARRLARERATHSFDQAAQPRRASSPSAACNGPACRPPRIRGGEVLLPDRDVTAAPASLADPQAEPQNAQGLFPAHDAKLSCRPWELKPRFRPRQRRSHFQSTQVGLIASLLTLVGNTVAVGVLAGALVKVTLIRRAVLIAVREGRA